uniref:RNA-directed DNA polymerase, eukaryota n=1 Tax=Tanacetum cinerariifolium TaxID=118510 RepID=A0A6L2LJ77_TANCI|nr:RNA-directed DNA polymerase, eukaryota [Tanacetum cinerariifolium]
MQNGIFACYDEWTHHGESCDVSDDDDVSFNDDEAGSDNINGDNDDDDDDDDADDDLDEMLDNIGQGTLGNKWKTSAESSSSIDKDLESLRRLLDDSHHELYTGCQSYSKFSFIVTMLHLKTTNCWSNKSFSDTLNVLKKALPSPSSVPKNFYEAKKYIQDLGFQGEKIHACVNDCVLYRGWSVKGYNACLICMNGTSSSYSSHSRNVCYMGHRRFFPSSHQWRNDKKNFDGTRETRKPIVPMSGLEVLIEFCTKELLEKFKYHVGVGSWFSSLEYASNSFVIDERVVWGKLLFEEDRKNMSLYSKRICIKTKMEQSIFETFKLIIKGKVFWIRAKEVSEWIPDFLEEDDEEDESDDDKLDNESDGEKTKKTCKPILSMNVTGCVKKPNNDNKEEGSSKATLKYPYGFTPDDVLRSKDVQDVVEEVEVHVLKQKSNVQVNSTKDNSFRGVTHYKEEDKESYCSGHFRSLEERVLPMHFLSFNIQGLTQKVKKDWVKELCNKNKVNFLSLQETKMEMIDNFCVNNYWGNFSFEFVCGPSVGNSVVLFVLGILGCSISTTLRFQIIVLPFNEIGLQKLKEGIMGFCPNITSITLDRYLLDHRPIILRGVCYDYGPVPFRMFHYWFEWDGFDRFITNTWSNSNISDNNAISKLMKKLRHLKVQTHLSVRDKKESASMKKSQLKGNWIEDPNFVKNEFLSHFKERFDSPCSSRLMLDWEFPNKLSADQNLDLDRNVTNDEIKRAVWDCGTDKSPRPDGFTFGFYRRYWDTIEKDVIEAVSFFFTSGTFPKGGNASFIALVPKMQDAKVVKDYRPISLISSLHKIIVKILANRLVRVLGDLVNEVQFAFIVNRQILDGPFILDELIHWCDSKKKETMIFKVDFKKAYDSVRWDYLDDVLNKFGFGLKWRNWIHNCLNSSKGSILVNGSPTGEFHFRKGLKQCDPLSPLLFYGEPSSFLSKFGLRMNLHKSKLMGISVEDELVFRAAIKMGCSTLKTHFSYLGIKMGGLMSRIKAWDEIVVILHARLSMWKMKTLSIRGRLTLLKSVLGSTPIYYMSIYKVPSKVLKCLEDIRHKFFIGADLKEKKMSWFKWSRVLASKDKGWLGVSSFFALNRALLFKWMWRFHNDRNALWSRFIRAVHGNSAGIEMRSRVSYSFTWLTIVNEVNKLRNKGIDLLSYMKIKVGNGLNTKFWDDVWMGNKIFKTSFPRIYALESDKKHTVVSKMIHNEVGFSLRRQPRDGVEMEQFRALTKAVEGNLLHARLQKS